MLVSKKHSPGVEHEICRHFHKNKQRFKAPSMCADGHRGGAREDTRRSRGCLRTRGAHLQCGSWLQGISFCNFKIILRRKNKNKHIKSTILFIQQLHLGTYNTGHPCGEKQPKTHIPQARLTTCKHRAGRSSAPRGRSVDSGP